MTSVYPSPKGGQPMSINQGGPLTRPSTRLVLARTHGQDTLIRRHPARRLLPPPPAREVYKRAAELQARTDQLAAERESRRIKTLGDAIAQRVETYADRQVGQGR